MTHDVPHLPGIRGWLLVLVVFALLTSHSAPEARGQGGKSSRQVTVFGIVATPNSAAMDPKLESIAPQLRELLPNHGFKLIDVKTKRLVAGQSVTCKLDRTSQRNGSGWTAVTTLVQPLDDDGKVQLRSEVVLNNVTRLATDVATPPNQLFFLDKMLDNGSRLLIGIGAR